MPLHHSMSFHCIVPCHSTLLFHHVIPLHRSMSFHSIKPFFCSENKRDFSEKFLFRLSAHKWFNDFEKSIPEPWKEKHWQSNKKNKQRARQEEPGKIVRERSEFLLKRMEELPIKFKRNMWLWLTRRKWIWNSCSRISNMITKYLHVINNVIVKVENTRNIQKV